VLGGWYILENELLTKLIKFYKYRDFERSDPSK